MEERRSYLEIFLRELAQHKFIIESEEFVLFAQSDFVDKALNALPKQNPSEILEKYR